MRQRIPILETLTGTKREHLKHVFRQNVVGYMTVRLNSQFEPIELGRYLKGPHLGRPFYASLEQLFNHSHYIAPTQLGKSKALLHNMREIIRRGVGLALIDPSEKGDTCYQLLHFCQQVNAKVLLIDLNLDSSPVINPFHRNKYRSVAFLADAFRVAFSVKDNAAVANINKYLPAIMHVLWNANLTLAESRYFTNKIYVDQRDYILEKSAEAEKKLNLDPRHRLLIEAAHCDARMYDRFVSTTSRLEPLFHPAIEALFGDKSSVQLSKLIAENYVILVNLNCPELDQLQRRLVGTILINEIIYNKRSDNPYFLFIDEAGQYATEKVAEVLDLMAKTRLYIGISHQTLAQFEDKRILDSILTNTKIKYRFEKKQEAYVKLNQMDEVLLRIPNVPDGKGEQDFGFHRKRSQVLSNIKNRIPYDTGSNSTSAKSGTTSNRKANNSDNSDSPGRELWDDIFPDDEGVGEA